MIRVMLASLMTMMSTAVVAAEAIAPMDAYEHAQRMRQEARELAKPETPEALRAAAARLGAALDYLARDDVRALGEGNIYLYMRGHDVRMDLAAVYARLGDADRAFAMLEAMQTYIWSEFPLKFLEKDGAFDALEDDPRFKAFVATARIPEGLWNTPSIATPYKEELTVQERIAGLSRFWAEARQYFVHSDHVPDLAWDRAYMETLPQVIAAKSTAEYYRVMMRFAARLEDGHTDVYPPRELFPLFYSRPPIRTAKIGEKVLVLDVPSPSLAKHVHPGDEIIAIDGVRVLEFGRRNVMPMESSSTPQDAEVRAFSYHLLAGDAKQPVRLTLESADGTRREESVARSGYEDVRHPEPFEFRMLPNGIAYLALDHFESDAGDKAFEKALPGIRKAKGLVLDVRRNGGGSTYFGLMILSHLTTQPIPVERSLMRADLAFSRNVPWIRWAPWPGAGRPFVREAEQYDGPVAVLVGPQTFSAAEDFLVSFDSIQRGVMVGTRTGGSTGQPMTFGLPGGGLARICVKRDTYPDGREFVGRGIMPQVLVQPTVEDVRAGRDPVLESAAQILLRGGSAK